MLPTSPFESRLPRYEGHLILNLAGFQDSPQTSTCTAWSERWCSLEDGKLLVYDDRTAAMISPDDTCAVIDVGSFVCVQNVPVSDGPPFELILSHTLPEPVKASRLFRPKSAMSLNRLQLDSGLRGTAEADPRPSMGSVGRTSFQASSLANSTFTFSAKADADGRPSSRNKSWARFTSSSRKLYSKASSSSSLRTNDSVSFRPDSGKSSIHSISDSRGSTDMASSGAPSPRTPHSSTFSTPAEPVHLRVSTAEAFRSWLEALTLTIKILSEGLLAPSPFMRQQKRVSSRPSLGNLPGFRIPTNLQSSPVFPTAETGRASPMGEATPKASRKRQSSSTSLTFALQASQDLQNHAVGYSEGLPAGSCKAPSIRAAKCSASSEPAEHCSASARASTSHTSAAFTAMHTKRFQRNRAHKRSLSTASSSFSLAVAAPALSTPRRNSVSSAQILTHDGSDASAIKPPRDSFAQPSLPLQPSSLMQGSSLTSQLDNEASAKIEDAGKSTAGGAVPVSSRHRRSGSILRFGSARILAWRDTFTASDSSRTAAPVGLGLEADESGICDASNAEAQHKSSKGFPRLRSFRLLPKSKAEGSEGDAALDRSLRDDSFSFASPSELRYGDENLAASSSTVLPPPVMKTKGMSRTSSLLSLTKNAFSSFREKSSSRQHVKHVFAVPQEEALPGDETHDTLVRVLSPGCDFSYELVGPTREASPVESPLLCAAAVVEQSNALDDEQAEEVWVDKADPIEPGSNCADEDDEGVSSPRLAVERILPPEQMISTFDQLRAADPTGRSWLSHIETASRRGSLDWAAATATRNKSLRLAASQQFGHSRGASIDLSAPRLRSSMSAWELQPDRRQPRPVGRDAEVAETEGTTTPRLSEEVGDGPLRSLPAPPRASKRRARVSTLLPAATIHPARMEKKAPLGDSTNTHTQVSRSDMPSLDKLVLADESPARRVLGRRLRASPQPKHAVARCVPLA